MTYTFTTSIEIGAPPELVFSTALSVDFHRASMAHTKEQAIAGTMTGEMTLGDDVTWRARHFGVWWTMTSTITEYESPRYFVDAQASGPFKEFWHRHTFEPLPNERTLMTDDVSFTAPLSFIGTAVERAILGRHLEALIETRNTALKVTCEAIRGAQDPR